MYLEFHQRDWLALGNKLLHRTGHRRIHLARVTDVDQDHVRFVTDKGAQLVAPTFSTIHGHGVGLLSLLRVRAGAKPPVWDEQGEPVSDCQLLVKGDRYHGDVLYPSLMQLERWLHRNHGDHALQYRRAFEHDIDNGRIGDHPTIIDTQRGLSYPVI